MIEELLKKKTHLKSLEDFLASPAYEGFIIGIREEIRQMEAVILDGFPADLECIMEQCAVRGELRCLESMLTRFMDAADELKDRIAVLEDEKDFKGQSTVARNRDSRIDDDLTLNRSNK